MVKNLLPAAGCCVLVTALLSGCVVRTYPLTRDRVDQELGSGNRGYLKGQGPSGDTAERKTTRTTRVVEIELRSPIKFEKAKETAKPAVQQQETASETLEGNRGYISGETPEVAAEPQVKAVESFEKYTVQKNDTLQKISQKYFGTTKKWHKIYKANQDVLKGPDKVYPGQVLNIPVEKTPQNIK